MTSHKKAKDAGTSGTKRTGEGNTTSSLSVIAPEQASYADLQPVMAASPDAIFAIDADFHVLACNPAAYETFGWPRGGTIGSTCADILICHNLNRIKLCGTSSCPLVRVLESKKPLANEELIVGNTDNTREISASVTPLTVDNEPYVVFTARDVSSLKFANQVRSNFVSMVSHELRTPLNSVHGFVDLLLMGHMGELNPEQKTYLGYAEEGVQQLIAIVDDILFMSRSDAGQLEMKQQEVNVRVLARQVVGSLDVQSHKAGVILQQDIPIPSPLIYADPQRMKQVLNNLVANAIKFTPPGKEVTIHARVQDEQFVLISVSDAGYGIPRTDQPHVFERFYQSNHREQSKMGGYGLGLSIAKLIIEQHGGKIYFESSTDGGGTTFYFIAPLYKGQGVTS